MTDVSPPSSTTGAPQPEDDATHPGAPASSTQAEPAVGAMLSDGPGALMGAATEVYLEALRRPGLTEEHLRRRGLSEGVIGSATEALQDAGMIRANPVDGTWEAISPDVTLPAYAHALEVRAASARAVADELTRVFRRARAQGGDTTNVEFLSTAGDLYDAVDETISTAHTIVRVVRDASTRTVHLRPRAQPDPRDVLLGHDGTPLTTRSTYDTAILDLPGAASTLMRRVESGEDCRFFAGVYFSVTIADTSTAVLDVSNFAGTTPYGALVRDARFVQALAAMADLVWSLGSPAARPSEAPLDRRSLVILTLLAGGATDATIAEQTAVSQRTVERTVRSLMQRLGAASRFQAGVLAVRRGWL